MTTKEKLRNFILKNYLFTDDASALGDLDSFLEQGILDSTGVLELVFFIEEEFHVKVDDEEITPENLDSIEKLTAFVGKKQN